MEKARVEAEAQLVWREQDRVSLDDSDTFALRLGIMGIDLP